LVYLVYLVYLVEQDQLDELNKPDGPDGPDEPGASRRSGFEVPKTSNFSLQPSSFEPSRLASPACLARLAVTEMGKKKPKPTGRVSAFPEG
jgi:hypothetical protein